MNFKEEMAIVYPSGEMTRCRTGDNLEVNSPSLKNVLFLGSLQQYFQKIKNKQTKKTKQERKKERKREREKEKKKERK